MNPPFESVVTEPALKLVSGSTSVTCARIVKKVVRRAEPLKGHYHGFRFQPCSLIEAADNPQPVHQLCHQTQHPKQDHHLESPRARPEPLPALSFDASQQVVQKQKEK